MHTSSVDVIITYLSITPSKHLLIEDLNMMRRPRPVFPISILNCLPVFFPLQCRIQECYRRIAENCGGCSGGGDNGGSVGGRQPIINDGAGEAFAASSPDGSYAAGRTLQKQVHPNYP